VTPAANCPNKQPLRVGARRWQIVNTLGPYCLLWYWMYRSLAISYWIALPLAILAGALDGDEEFSILFRTPTDFLFPNKLRSSS